MNEKRKATLYIYGLPKSTCTRRDLFTIFSSVAQVHQVSICSDEGIGSVTLCDTSSAEFILEKNWDINGCKLKLSRRPTRDKTKITTKPQKQQEREEAVDRGIYHSVVPFRSYSDYQRKRPAFWQDVPHHNSQMVKSNRHRKKQHHFWRHTVPIQTCKVQSRKIKRRRKKRKHSKVTAIPDWTCIEPCHTLTSNREFGSCTLPIEVSHKKYSQTSQTSVHEVITNNKEHDDQCLESTKFNQMSIVKTTNNATPSHSNDRHIPVSVRSNGKKYIIPVDTLRPLQSVTEGIKQIERIPPRNQLLFYQGHVLNDNVALQQLQPHDHVEIIVKAKGGMLNEGVDTTAESGPEPTTNSTEDEVTKWLKDVVRIQEETLTKCCEVDGEMLFRYNRNEYKTFADDFDITIGQALRILVVRDGSCYKHADTKVAGWTKENVSSFMMEILKSKESAERVCQFVKKNMIDGLVLCQYDGDLDIYRDFPDIGIQKGIIKKIFTKLGNLLAESRLDEKYVSCISASQTVNPREVFQNKNVKEMQSSDVITLSSRELSPRTHDNTSAGNVAPDIKTDVTTINTEDVSISTCTTGDTFERPFVSKEKSTVKRESDFIHVLDAPTNKNTINDPTLTQIDADTKQTSIAGKAKRNILSGTTSSATGDQCTSESENPVSVMVGTINTNTREYFTFIEKTLHLSSCRPSAIKPCCPLNLHVFSYNSSRLNELQKQLLFFVLLREKDLPTGESQKIFWHKIAKEPMLWLNRVLTPTEKNMIKPTKSEGKLKINGKECSLIGLQVTMQRVMDKGLQTLLSFNNHILLVHRHALEKDTIGYVVKLQSHRGKSTVTYNFTFFHEKKYILFDLEDFSYGFTDLEIDSCKQGTLQPWEGSVSLPPEDVQNVHVSIKHGSEMKSNISVSSNNVQTKIPFESEIKQQRNDSNVLVLSDFQNERFIDLSNTSDKQNMKNEAMPMHEFEHLTASNLSEQNRYFGKSSSNLVYREGRTLVELENNDSLSGRCISYQHFNKEFNPQNDPLMSDIIFRTLKFACACLNSRRNGTIYFGVGTEDGVRRNEVIGIILNFEQDRQIIADHLRCCINKYFLDPLSNVTNQCISPPHFIQVVQNEASVARFVMEFDIEPKSSVCKDMFFKMSWPVIHEKNVKGRCAYGFVFDGLETKQISGNDEKLFILTDLKEKIMERQQKEEFKSIKNEMSESAFSKLQRRLLGGQDKIIPSVWYSLVLTCPTVQQKMDNDWKNCFNFIKRMPITAVFDFDDESNVNGLCCHLRNCEKTQLQSWLIFEQNPGSYEKLQSILKVPYSDENIWVFCNGRIIDSNNKYPHLKRDEWMLEYSTGISQAVHFLKSSIPKKRLYVMILLLSNDLEGVIDTFVDFIGRFGWEYVVLIAEEEKIFDEFCKAILLERKGTRQQLEEISLVGLPWEQGNAAMNEISGHNEYGSCYIPASSGGTIPLEEKFLESLTDLEILSATQCENKEFKDDKKRRAFAHNKEIEFYRGNKVTWWNYFFNTHVLKRNCFQELHDNINSLLCVKQPDNKVATVMITYEPGAGGSTLGRHLLWAFRKKFRCAVVKKITDRTHSNIMFLHQYKEDTSNAKPVILLVDEVPQSDFFFYELENSINIKNRTVSNHNQLICCMIVLQRDEHLDDLSNQPSMYRNACMNKQFHTQNLRQKCFPKEIDWLKDKYCELEETGKDLGMDFKPEHLISFMILRQSFKEEYVKNTVHSLMDSTQMSPTECLLLKYASLISAFMPFSRLGFKTYIPLECCDTLMTVNSSTSSSNYWERHLSHTTRIFLVIEKKENASGMQVRVAHAILAKAVLREFLEIENKSLGKIIEEFLDCPLFESATHGRKDLIEMTKEMLKRRLKEEYDDEVNTSFSPLIEEILEHPSGCKTQSAVASAVTVLKKGFEKFKDPMIAQSLARLHTKHEQFEEAITYAEKAVELSPPVGRSYCTHTLGYVLKTNFIMDTHQLGKLSPWNSTKYLNVIFRALGCFREAQKDRFTMQDHDFLFSYIDTVSTIIMICGFLKDCVDVSDLFLLTQYLTDDEYIPDEVKDSWDTLHSSFKSLQQVGENVFEKLEDHISFNTTYYEHGGFTGKIKSRLPHRSCRLLWYKYPIMLSDFATYFGEDKDDPPQQLRGEMRNRWHRRRILTLQGNVYWGFFHTQNSSQNQSKNKKELDRLTKIKKHLDAITEKDSKDMSNCVCVNVALGLLGCANRLSDEDIYNMCRHIVTLGKERVEIGHFFVMMLMWPTSILKVPYNDDAFKDSLKFLSDKSKKSKRQILQKPKTSFPKEGKTMLSPSTQFFLTKLEGLRSICHRSDIFFKENHDSQTDRGANFWDQPNIQQTLKTLRGQLVFNDGIYIQVENPHTPGKYFQIRKTRSGGREYHSEEEVTFYVGFSMAGPIAYDVKPLRYDQDMRNTLPQSSNIGHYKNKDITELKEMQRRIRQIEQKRPDRRNEREFLYRLQKGASMQMWPLICTFKYLI
ncbi:sterile alpha motif domain-containing protein 9-like isoform X2 [Mizuhopecten yessoensis]|uniref:sterile alpha motif domain-containing protein 9-like isoform X2 n=1 Tax=Mizuhopecten yessoensis TaxID=6573 RepID=UPI000B45B1FB|nr:sterile alpha motif domain-containing protein 9-like isoform X2 [Mizuhopecten yessoensis]